MKTLLKLSALGCLPVLGCLMILPMGTTTASAQSGPVCQSYSITTYGRSAAAFKKARTRRAKRRAIRRWVRVVEGRTVGARGKALPVAGTVYSNINNARIHSFNCSGRPLKCVLRATPCRAS